MKEKLNKLLNGRSLFWMIVHIGIIINFLIELYYSSYILFFVLRPEGISGPLWEKAKEIPHELMVDRRLYATEFWIAFAGLAIYLALTEIQPRFWKQNK